jgi:hypothetical protein
MKEAFTRKQYDRMFADWQKMDASEQYALYEYLTVTRQMMYDFMNEKGIREEFGQWMSEQ